jgi:tetratricopeptide (TPR) repeat protein
VSVALGEHDWAEQFLEQHRTELAAHERDNLYRYNLAYLHFQQHDYARAMPLLQQVELDDPLNNLDARRMLLRSYFELGEWEALDSLLQSFSAYLRRQKNLGYHRTTNENLVIFAKKLLELNRADLKAVAALRAEIDATPDVAERAWLLEQVGKRK